MISHTLVFILATVSLGMMIQKPGVRKALYNVGKMKGEYLATKYGNKVKIFFGLWFTFLGLDLTISAVYLSTPQIHETVFFAGILHGLVELFSTLLFIVAYEFIATSEILVRITVKDRENLTSAKDFDCGRSSIESQHSSHPIDSPLSPSFASSSTLHESRKSRASEAKVQNMEISKIREQLYDLLD
jgi:hypothetical protein